MKKTTLQVSDKFLAEAGRLRIDAAYLAGWICEEFAHNSARTIAIPKADWRRAFHGVSKQRKAAQH
jgi:hypothetical protein